MLTLDLLRYRIHGDTVTPTYLTVRGGRKYIELAERLIGIYRSCVGGTLGELDEAIEDMLGTATDYKVCRGLAKILADYVIAAPASDLDAEELRKKVFTIAADDGPTVHTPDLLFTRTASEKVSEIAAKIGIPADELQIALYADLRENNVIRSFDSSITAIEAIERYNLALAQAMLFRSTRMVIDVYDGYQPVFKHIKLARLMHSIKSYKSGYRININGPLSLFSNVERYGVAMARVLPAVLKCMSWQLLAKVNVGDGESIFQLTPEVGLKSHYRDQPVFDSALEEAFYTRFVRNKKSKWIIEREGAVLDLKETILIPNFKFTHEDGRVAHLEMVGFWTPEYLQKKMDKLNRVEESNVIVAVPEKLNCSREAFKGSVVYYKERLLIKNILPALELVAR